MTEAERHRNLLRLERASRRRHEAQLGNWDVIDLVRGRVSAEEVLHGVHQRFRTAIETRSAVMWRLAGLRAGEAVGARLVDEKVARALIARAIRDTDTTEGPGSGCGQRPQRAWPA
jgi:hypothetical protein